jgi:D-alanyl-D-alanine carboxypeptidase/D-alanyl-D-alanine-endopeptidase (penicillin-binding protein 4)
MRVAISQRVFAAWLALVLSFAPSPARPEPPSAYPARGPVYEPATIGDPWTSDEVAALQRDLDATLTGAPALRGAHAGVLVSDARTGATLYGRNADDEFQPASTFKLVVGSAALEKLGEDYRFRTTASLARVGKLPGSVRNGVLRGALVVRGGGDPFLSVRDLDNLALAIAQRGIKHIRGPLLIDASRYDRAPYPPGWTWDDFTYDYAAKASALTVEENVVHVYVAPGPLRGRPATVVVAPPVVRVSSSVTTLARGAATSADVDPDPSGRLHLSGGIALGSPTHAIDAAVADPQAYVYKVLVERLRAHGVDVARATRALDPRSAAKTRRVWMHLSAPLWQLLPRFWIPSDNLVGEMLLKEIGFASGGSPGTTLKGIAFEKHWLQSLGLDLTTFTLADGCGMSQYDRITPRALVAILQHDWKAPYRSIVLSALPVGGARGTIEGIAGTPAAGRVFAKTGSMLHVRALAGYLATRRHGTVAFAFSVDDWNGNYPDLAALRAQVLSRIVTD